MDSVWQIKNVNNNIFFVLMYGAIIYTLIDWIGIFYCVPHKENDLFVV